MPSDLCFFWSKTISIAVEPVGVNSCISVFLTPQVISISNFRRLSLLLLILFTFEIFIISNSD